MNVLHASRVVCITDCKAKVSYKGNLLRWGKEKEERKGGAGEERRESLELSLSNSNRGGADGRVQLSDRWLHRSLTSHHPHRGPFGTVSSEHHGGEALRNLKAVIRTHLRVQGQKSEEKPQSPN